MNNKLRFIKAKLRANMTNSKGWKTNRKILVIESDDWGSIRMPSKEVYNIFVKKGFTIQNTLYNRFDSLASVEDLNFLFETLSSFKDIHDRPLKITANAVVANPDFDKIKASDYREYFYEPFTETMKKYPKHSNSFGLWQKGIDEGMFYPQFHGREHLNIHLWIKDLQLKNKDLRFTFNHRTTYSGKSDYNYMEAFDNKKSIVKSHKQIIKDGLDLFYNIFGYKSKSFIAPCYVWHSDLNKILKKNGVDYIQGSRAQLEPTEEHMKYKQIPRYTGEKNIENQIQLIRNVTFEPSSIDGMDWVNYAYAQIETAFAWKKPAIITSHRVNYIGYLDENNRDRSLKLLKELIIKVQKKWPEVEFLSSDELGGTIKGGNYTGSR